MLRLTEKPDKGKILYRMGLILCISLMAFLIPFGNQEASALLLQQYRGTQQQTRSLDLPTGETWKYHLKEDLLPFWEMPTALGEPLGNFPTYRCNDGSLYNEASPCPELQEPAVDGIVDLDKDYVRAKSRQVYAYGVAYHMTGDRKYLNYAKAGVDYLRKHAIDRENGGAYTYFEGSAQAAGPTVDERISQDMAYAVSSLGFYYYLTRDEAVLADLVGLKNYIFDNYYDPEKDLIVWDLKGSKDKELVAQLDQVYGYMLWLTPTLPDEQMKAQWKKDLVHLAHIMIEQFYSEEENLFWGAVTTPEKQHLGQDHTDFGHSIKTLWLIYETGKLTDNLDLVNFARERAAKILHKAYIPANGSWGRRIDADGRFDADKEWWILAELDQVAATLSLVDPTYVQYLVTTYQYWFDYMVDHQNHEMWHWVNADGTPNTRIPKQHSWKNAFHSFEHALVGYITGQQYHRLPVTLYFAFKETPSKEQIEPYFYAGKVHEIEEYSSKDFPASITWQKVTFTDIR